MSTNNSQDEKDKKSFSIPIVDILFGLLDLLFKDANGKVLASRVATLIILFVMAIIWVKGDQIMHTYKESSFENYAKIIQLEKDKQFNTTIQEQLQIVHVSSGSDFSAVYVFRPKNLNYFVDLEVYEGKIPESVDSKNMGGYPVDKTSSEYSVHLSGMSFESKEEFIYLPTTNEDKKVSYMFSCPYFNIDNIYSGSISMYWFSEPKVNKKRLDPICNQAARAIGRSR